MGMVVEGYSLSALAREFGMTTRTVARRLSGVASCGKKGNAVLYRLADAAPALLAGRLRAAGEEGEPLDLQQESAKLKAAQREKLELEIAVLRGELLEAPVVSAAWADLVIACRQRLLALPSTAATRVIGLDQRDTEKELRNLVYEALNELTTTCAPDYKRTREIMHDEDAEAGA